MALGTTTLAVILIVLLLVQLPSTLGMFQAGIGQGIAGLVATVLPVLGVIAVFFARRWALPLFAIALVSGLVQVLLVGEWSATALGVLGTQLLFLINLWRYRTSLQ